MNEIINQIAKRMGVETLETRHDDDIDFHDLAVWTIKEALQAAYKAGLNAKK